MNMKLTNKYEIVGVLMRAPERRFWSVTDESKYCVRLLVQTYREWKGERRNVQVHEVEVMGECRDMAESLRVGEVVRLSGYMTGREWENKRGEKRVIGGLKAVEVEVVTKEGGDRREAGVSQHERAKANGYMPEPSDDRMEDDDIPF